MLLQNSVKVVETGADFAVQCVYGGRLAEYCAYALLIEGGPGVHVSLHALDALHIIYGMLSDLVRVPIDRGLVEQRRGYNRSAERIVALFHHRARRVRRRKRHERELAFMFHKSRACNGQSASEPVRWVSRLAPL